VKKTLRGLPGWCFGSGEINGRTSLLSEGNDPFGKLVDSGRRIVAFAPLLLLPNVKRGSPLCRFRIRRCEFVGGPQALKRWHIFNGFWRPE
jgi:hypothetical protein